jgi:hypothetical protein
MREHVIKIKKSEFMVRLRSPQVGVNPSPVFIGDSLWN